MKFHLKYNYINKYLKLEADCKAITQLILWSQILSKCFIYAKSESISFLEVMQLT